MLWDLPSWADVSSMLELVDLSLEVLASVFISLKADSTTRGNSWLAPRFGFVCDNIANFEVGLPNIVQRFIPPGPSGSKSRALSSKNWTICWHTAKKAEVDSLRRIDAGDGLPGHEVIEFLALFDQYTFRVLDRQQSETKPVGSLELRSSLRLTEPDHSRFCRPSLR